MRQPGGAGADRSARREPRRTVWSKLREAIAPAEPRVHRTDEGAGNRLRRVELRITDPAPLRVESCTSIARVHLLMTMLRLRELYIVEGVRLVGEISREDLMINGYARLGTEAAPDARNVS